VESNMDLNSLFQRIYKMANPNATDEDISKQVQLSIDQQSALKDPLSQLMTQMPQKEAQEQVEASPEEPKIENVAKNPLDFNIPSANQVPSNFNVSSGMQPTTLKMEGAQGDVTPPAVPAPLNPELPAPTSPAPAPTMPVEPPTKAVGTRKSTTKDVVAKNPLDTLLDTSSKDYEARKQFDEDERKRHMWGALPMGLAGIGDAISNAASAFGAKGTTGGLERVQATLLHGEKLRKEQFDEKLKNDPNSDISKHYKDTLAMMMSTKPTDPKIAHLSAAQIEQTMPEVEKFITHQLQRDLVRSQKDLAVSEKQSQFDSRQWERLESKANNLNAGSRKALGVASINNMRADRLLATSDMKIITPQVYNALVADLQGIYKGGVPDQVMMQHGDYQTIQRKAAEVLQQITGKPQNVNTPEIKQYLLDLTRDIKAIDNKVINDNLGIQAVAFRDLIRKDPERWNDLVTAINRTTEEPITATGHGTTGAASKVAAGEIPKGSGTQNGPVKVTSQAQYDSLSVGAQYIDDSGKTKVKK